LNSGLASYNGNGKIINKENTLTSNNGYYYSKSKDFYFKKNVVLVNPQYIVKCDTLKYNTLSEIAYFLSPTKIISKENSIYCENGWYDTKLDIAQFNKHASLKNPKQELTGDSLYYNRNLGYGKAIGSIEMNDSTENITIKGDFGEYFENDDNTIVTGHALLIQKFYSDTLFLHADLLRLTNDSALSKSLESKLKKVVKAGKSSQNNKKEKKIVKAREMDRRDSKRVLMAYNKVKFYKNDLQGKCDSLVFTYRDSTMRLFTAPIIWSDINQLTADSINIHTYQGIIKSMDLKKNSFIASKEDSIGYNQICGKNMKGHFTQNKLSKMDVFGNGQTIYYAQDKDGIIGVNKTVCSNMVHFINDDKIII
jgi:lipopolysaccharide export system protein LptA